MAQENIDNAASQTSADTTSDAKPNDSQNATESETPVTGSEAVALKAARDLKAAQGREKARSRDNEHLRALEARAASAEQQNLVMAQSLESGDHEGLVSKMGDVAATANQTTVQNESPIIVAQINGFLGEDSPINHDTPEVVAASAEFNAAQTRGDLMGMRRARDMVETAHDQATTQIEETKVHQAALAERDKVIADLKAKNSEETDPFNLDTGPSASSSTKRYTYGDLANITKDMGKDPKVAIAKAKEAMGDFYKESR